MWTTRKKINRGTTFPEESKIEVRGHTLPYVSRGGLKLEKAMKEFQVSVEGKVCTDVRFFYRWIYRLYVAKWRGQGVCH